MPSKKKKYNARFPPARIKKIMQTDEDVGKVAAAVPVIISRSLELFIDSLIEKTASITRAKNAKTLSTSHIKQAIHSEKTFDFLRDLVANVPDHQAEEDGDTGLAAMTSGQERKPRVAKPRKPREEGARGPGRPRKVKVEEKREEVEVEANEEDDEETESDEEQRSPQEDSSSSQNNTSSPPASMADPSQGSSYLTPHQFQGTAGPVAGVSSQQFPPVSLHPPPGLPVHHQPSSLMSQDRAHSAMYPHPSQIDKGNPNTNYMPPHFNFNIRNMTIPGQFPYPPGSHGMGHMPPFVPHPNVGPYMGPGMTHYPPHYMMPGSPFMPPGVPVPPRTFSDGRDPYRHIDPSQNHTEEASGPLDMSCSARSQPVSSEYSDAGTHRAESIPHLNSQHSPLQGSRDLNSHLKGLPGDRRSRSRSPVSSYRSINDQCNSDGHNGQDIKQSKPPGFNTSLSCDSSVNSKQTVSDNGDQKGISFPALSNIMKMNVKPSDTQSEDDDYDS